MQLASDVDDKVTFQLTKNLTMPNDFRGRGKVGTGSYVLTTTGAISPRDTGLSSRTKVVGTIYFQDLKMGSASTGCTYYWQYNDATNDIIACDTLTFGNAANTLTADWIGTNDAPTGEFPIMTYAGTDPDIGSWNVTSSKGYGGRVFLDAGNKRLMVRLSTSGTIIIFK